MPLGIDAVAGAAATGAEDGGPSGTNRLGIEFRGIGSVLGRFEATEFGRCCVASASEIGVGTDGATKGMFLDAGVGPDARIGVLPK
jgi:hypothetical protein